MRVLAFGHTGAGSLSWTADADYNFVGSINNSGGSNSFISLDPEMTGTGNLPPVSVDRVLFIQGASTTRWSSCGPVKIPIAKGRTVISTVSAGMTLLVYLEEADFNN
jgi:hypothetical protein